MSCRSCRSDSIERSTNSVIIILIGMLFCTFNTSMLGLVVGMCFIQEKVSGKDTDKE